MGPALPRLLYGTAWKEDETARLTGMALAAGIRGIDTANQRRHYHEAAVGEALKAAFARGLDRTTLFIQTKFTHLGGQDERLPYDAQAPVARQVEQSFESSLVHLGVDVLDAYVLHGPSQRVGLAEEDWEAWRAMEAIHHRGKARALGVSNVSPAQLELLLAKAAVKPTWVQNRCFASLGWDRAVRQLCAAHGVAYQGFSLLTANGEVVAHSRVRQIAARLRGTPAQVVFALAAGLGMVALTGTSSAEHLAQDLAAPQLGLTAGEVEELEALWG